MTQARIFLVEDDIDTNRHLASLMRASKTIEFMGTATTHHNAMCFLQDNDIDCLVTDICLPDGSGLDLIKWCKDNRPQMHSLVISVLGDEKTLLNAISVGADGYLLKDMDERRLCSALDDIMNGGAPISAFMAKHILKSVPQESDASEKSTIEIDLPQLTAKETNVLNVIARGYSYKEAAQHLNISPNTVPNHIKNIYRKLQVHSRGEAVYEAMRLGIIDKAN